MDLETLALLGEFLGGAAVLVSLIYLAIQIRQGNRQVEHNTRSLEVSTYQAITSDLNDFRALLITHPDLGRIYLQGLEDPSGVGVVHPSVVALVEPGLRRLLDVREQCSGADGGGDGGLVVGPQ